MSLGHDHQKQKVTHADVLKASTDQDMTGDPSLYSLRFACGLPSVALELWIEAHTLALRKRGGQLSLQKPFGVVYRRQPPGDPKTLWR